MTESARYFVPVSVQVRRHFLELAAPLKLSESYAHAVSGVITGDQLRLRDRLSGRTPSHIWNRIDGGQTVGYDSSGQTEYVRFAPGQLNQENLETTVLVATGMVIAEAFDWANSEEGKRAIKKRPKLCSERRMLWLKVCEDRSRLCLESRGAKIIMNLCTKVALLENAFKILAAGFPILALGDETRQFSL